MIQSPCGQVYLYKELDDAATASWDVLCHVFSSHFVTPRDMSCDFLLCLLFCSSPFPRPSVFPHHVPFYLCLFVFPFRPVALLPTLAAPFILCAFGTWLH